VFLGKFAPFDISDVCGMNLWDIKAGKWHENFSSSLLVHPAWKRSRKNWATSPTTAVFI